MTATDEQVRRTRYRVVAGSCLDCAGDVAGVLQRISSVERVEVLPTAGVVIIEHTGDLALADVNAAGARLGLELQRADSRVSGRAQQAWWRQPKWLALAIASLLLIAGELAEHAFHAEGVALALFVATLAVGGFWPLQSAARALRSRGRLTISTLLVVAAVGAIALGIVGEAALLVVVFSLGEALEDYASDRARGSIQALMNLTPEQARRRTSEGWDNIAVEDLILGDVCLVRPGERLPTDGEIVAGRSAVDQSPITGESVPVEVGPGATAYGGTINGPGALELRVTKPYQDTVLARVVHQVEEAQASKGQAQRFADRFGAVYTPAMFGLAVVVAASGSLITGDPREWVYRALVLLVVSCSCALVLSVPVAVVAAISRAARDGILVKGGVHLEALAGVRALAVDKTGTLTKGRPTVTDIVPVGDRLDADEVLAWAAAVEEVSEHPLAAAITGEARRRAVRVRSASDGRAEPGKGVHAIVDGRDCFVGRPAESGTPTPTANLLEELESAGKTAVVVTVDGEEIGVIGVADELRPGMADMVRRVHRLGVGHVTMLTGDNERTAASIALAAGIDAWRARLLPADKTSAVAELRSQHGSVAMVGDGVNDAPAMATADVGIAMGAAGTDVALETADVALMADDLGKLPYAIGLAQRAVRNLRQNIALSLATVAVLVTAALLGRLSLTTGLLLNEGSALLIIANGLRLLRPAPTAP